MSALSEGPWAEKDRERASPATKPRKPPKRHPFIGFCWFVTLIAAICAAFIFPSAFSQGASAPQQASIAAIAIAMVVIPYVFTRAAEALSTQPP